MGLWGLIPLLPPLGRRVKHKTIEHCFDLMADRNQGSNVSRIENVPEQLLSLFPKVKFSHYNKGYEYCYFRQDLVALKGEPYKSKRSTYNYFIKNYPHEFVAYGRISVIDPDYFVIETWTYPSKHGTNSSWKSHHCGGCTILRSTIIEMTKLDRN